MDSRILRSRWPCSVGTVKWPETVPSRLFRQLLSTGPRGACVNAAIGRLPRLRGRHRAPDVVRLIAH
jgi:hypothetical protein